MKLESKSTANNSHRPSDDTVANSNSSSRSHSNSYTNTGKSLPSNTFKQDLFQLDTDIIYLNHAAVAPWPQATLNAVCRFAQENAQQGSWHYPQWLQVEQALREQFCRVIGVDDSSSIALVKNTSEALSFVAYGLDWTSGENIVISNQEFPSNRVLWESLKSRGVDVRVANIATVDDAESALFAQCDENTRLLSISAVQYASGIRMNLQRIGEFCQRRNILFCVDAIQQAGALPLSLADCQVDFAMADGHKWLLGPEGLGFFYIKPSVMNQLKLTQFGWHMLENPSDFDKTDWRIADTARRFECGSPNMMGIHALHASLSVIEQVGLTNVANQVLDNSRYLFDRLLEIPGVRLVTPRQDGRYAGIVSFYIVDKDMNQLFRFLSQQKIFCALRGNAIRFSPHFHTPRWQLEQSLRQVEIFVAR